jgi:hypothetical protein
MTKFKLTQSSSNTAHLRFPGYKDAEFALIANTVRINDLIEQPLDFDILLHLGKDGKVVSVEIIGD